LGDPDIAGHGALAFLGNQGSGTGVFIASPDSPPTPPTPPSGPPAPSPSEPAAMPEPSSLVLFGMTGVLWCALAWVGRRRRCSARQAQRIEDREAHKP